MDAGADISSIEAAISSIRHADLAGSQ